MNNKFKLLECNDDDVISFNGRLVKFSQFYTDLENEFREKVNNIYIYGKEDQRAREQRIYQLTHISCGQCDLTINLSSPREGKECEILRLGAKSWQKVKVRTQAFIEFFPTNTTEKTKIQLILEFSPDEREITEPESPLDDIRRKINEVST